jgi:hypothetical protein
MNTPIAELRQSLSDFATRCRAARWFGALFRVGVAQAIVEDVERQQVEIANKARGAEQADLQAAKILEEAARNGLQASDMAAVAKAIRLIRLSAKRDQSIAEAANV